VPAFHPRLSLHWLHVAAPLAVGGFWLAAFAWRLSARAALPVYEIPLLLEASSDAPQHAAT
jgi:hypothetical protein